MLGRMWRPSDSKRLAVSLPLVQIIVNLPTTLFVTLWFHSRSLDARDDEAHQSLFLSLGAEAPPETALLLSK
jgi:hypothetical protein